MLSDQVSYTTEEIAKLLKISRLTVYDLIKKGELVSYRVGKQMRVDATDLEAYKNRLKGVNGSAPAVPEQQAAPRGTVRPVVITGQDASLDLLARHIEKRSAVFRPLRSFTGSLDSLISMYRGQSDIVSAHLLDGDTGEYNVPYTRKLLVGSPHIVVRLLTRQAGLYVKKGNPLGLAAWSDLSRPGLRLINRERGSGTRVLLDEQLRLHGIDPLRLEGYADEQSNHLGVAAKVAAGEADVGVGSEKTAAMVDRVTFVPLARERYDLVLLKKPGNETLIDAVLGILRSDNFKEELRAVSGYDLSRTGEIVYEG